MNIENLENKLYNIENKHMINIIKFIIEAVRDYPVYELDDTEFYFCTIKKLLHVDEITLQNIDKYLKCDREIIENKIWIETSLSSLFEAFELMNIHNVTFEEIEKEIKKLETDV